MDEPPPPRASRPPPISAPFALLALSLGCTASVLLALVAALLGKGVPPFYLLAVPPTLVVAWLLARR